MEGAQPTSSAGEPLQVALLTTSFPLTPDSTSGIFVARLLGAMPSNIAISVITPDSRFKVTPNKHGSLRLIPVRYAPKAWQRLAHEPGGLPVSLQRAPWLRMLIPALVASLAFRTLWLARAHQLIHANWAFNGCVAGIAGALTGRPVLTSLRGEDVSRAKKTWFARLTLRLSIMFSRTIVAVSSDMAVWLKETFPASAQKIAVVENGVDAAFLDTGDARLTRAPHAVPVLVCVGSLIPRKGHAVLLRALARCSAFSWRLQLAGEGSERDTLSRLANELGVTDRVEFLGQLSPEAIPAFLANADLFILPSFAEGRSNALLEAMAAGLPVIASAIDGVRELIDDGRTGHTFPPGDDQSLADVLRPLLQDAGIRSKLGRAAHEEIKQRHLTWGGSAEKYVKLYHQMLKQA